MWTDRDRVSHRRFGNTPVLYPLNNRRLIEPLCVNTSANQLPVGLLSNVFHLPYPTWRWRRRAASSSAIIERCHKALCSNSTTPSASDVSFNTYQSPTEPVRIAPLCCSLTSSSSSSSVVVVVQSKVHLRSCFLFWNVSQFNLWFFGKGGEGRRRKEKWRVVVVHRKRKVMSVVNGQRLDALALARTNKTTNKNGVSAPSTPSTALLLMSLERRQRLLQQTPTEGTTTTTIINYESTGIVKPRFFFHSRRSCLSQRGLVENGVCVNSSLCLSLILMFN